MGKSVKWAKMKINRNRIQKSASLVVRSLSNWHRPSDLPIVLLFSTPRSGSTWLMELIQSQPGFKRCSEPFNLRVAGVSSRLGLDHWEELYQDDSWPFMERYLDGLFTGRLRFLNQSPRAPLYRPFTDRTVTKILHAGEARINQLRDRFNGRVVFLLRHPIAVSLSREVTPRLQAFLESDYRKNFRDEELRLGRRIFESGSRLQKGVLDWCLQNAVPLRAAQPDWIVVSYEEMVLAPGPILDRLAIDLQLEFADRLKDGLRIPSDTARKSDRKTEDFLNQKRRVEDGWWLVEKWRDRVGEAEERDLMEILEQFGIDCYRFGEVIPRPPVWLGSRIERPGAPAPRPSVS